MPFDLLNSLLSANKEYGRYLAQVGHTGSLPVTDGSSAYPFVGGGYASRNAHAGIGAQRRAERIEHLAVAVRCLYE